MTNEHGSKRIDQDWKAEASREKEELQQSAGRTADQEPGARAALPDASLASLVAGLRAQALLALGVLADPDTGEAEIDRDQAKYLIDTLGVLEKKTAGNLTAEEKALLDTVLYELRVQFLRM